MCYSLFQCDIHRSLSWCAVMIADDERYAMASNESNFSANIYFYMGTYEFYIKYTTGAFFRFLVF